MTLDAAAKSGKDTAENHISYWEHLSERIRSQSRGGLEEYRSGHRSKVDLR
jgi:hypothetical protein